MLTGIKDLDREILSKVPDDELLKACTVDKRFWNDVCDDNFLRRRLSSKYPGIENYKSSETWKQFFLSVIFYISKMKEDYNFEYTEGNFKKQYNLLEKYKTYSGDTLLVEAIREKEFPLIVHTIKTGVKQHSLIYALYLASREGYLEAVKYLVENGVDIHYNEDVTLKVAAMGGYLNIVKYLVEKGANVNAHNTEALIAAAEHGHYDVVKYLVDRGAIVNDKALKGAVKYGHDEIIEFLRKNKK